MAGAAGTDQKGEGLAARFAGALTAASTQLAVGAVLVTVLTWEIVFRAPSTGLDPSWGAALTMAVEQGLNFGTEIIYTFGPLGFLAGTTVWSTSLAAVAVVFALILRVALVASLIWRLRQTIGVAGAVVVGFIVLSVTPAIEMATVLVATWALTLLARDRPPRLLPWFAVIAGLFAAVEVLIKLSVGPMILFVAATALIGARAGRAHLIAFLLAFASGFVALWAVTGGDLATIDDYAINSIEIITGYGEAMSSASLGAVHAVALIAVLVATVAAGAFGDYEDRRARIAAILILAAAGFVAYKSAVTRFDLFHSAIGLATLAGLWIAIPWRRTLRLPMLAGLAAIIVLIFSLNSLSFRDAFHPIDSARAAGENIATLLSDSRRERLQRAGRDRMMESSKIAPRLIDALEGKTVTVLPYDTSAAWLYDLDWSPLPVFQDYVAYTARLDRLNTDVIESPEGPEAILRHVPPGGDPSRPARGIDGRNSAWNPPAQQLAILCNFVPVETAGPRWQVLERVPDRCGKPRPLGTVVAEPGEPVEIPAARRGEVVILSIEGAHWSPLEKIRGVLLRPKSMYAVFDQGAAGYRLIPATSGDGLMVAGRVPQSGRRRFMQVPSARTIQLFGPSGELTYRFDRVRVSSVRGSQR